MNNLIRENLQTIMDLSNDACDILSHMNGNYNFEHYGYRNGGVYHEDSKNIEELKELKLVVGPLFTNDYTEGCAAFQLTTRGKDVAETLFWLVNGEEAYQLVKENLKQAQDQSLMDLY